MEEGVEFSGNATYKCNNRWLIKEGGSPNLITKERWDNINPEGGVYGNPADEYKRIDTDPATPASYVKETGTGNTGWDAKD
jgi:hypothetical protein